MQDLLRGVLGQVKLVEASVALRQSLNISCTLHMHLEVLWTTHTLQCFEAFQWNLGGTCDELQEQGDLFLVEGSKHLP